MATPSNTPANTIFVQMASYRDAELIPTLVDLVERARRPDLLRIVVCWQHAPDETLGAFWQQGFGKWRVATSGAWNVHFMSYGGAQIELIDVPHWQTQGACWARNLIQQHYAGERYTMQLDSHHRFVDGWDALVIDMLESLRDVSPKPVLTTYLPMYEPGGDLSQARAEPQILAFRYISAAGIVLFHPIVLPDWQAHQRPVPSRFFSAHFAFADGHFAEAVQHDPEYFFHGEEISIAARAFTHGYDLYQPHRHVGWHEYTRSHRTKMWDDHTPNAQANGSIDEPWHTRNDRSYQRNRQLFGIDDTPVLPDAVGSRYGFGTARTLAQYEAYAGISFRHRGVQQATLDHVTPVPGTPLPASEAEWEASLRRYHDIRLCVPLSSLDQDAHSRGALEPGAQDVLAAAHRCRAAVYDDSETVMHRQAADKSLLSRHRKGNWFDFYARFHSELERRPAHYVVELLGADGALLSQIRRQIKSHS
jgi:hypothetical protein